MLTDVEVAILVLMVAIGGAWAGYGDPIDGLPSFEERELHVWTNAARVEPAAFESYYQSGGCSYFEDFSETEKTPQAPVNWHHGLNDVARAHSDDMSVNSWFSHDSSDGTSFTQRVSEYYSSGYIGENIAVGAPDAIFAVFEMWMCSDGGHRGNIMNPDWEELGTGVSGAYLTQDFGQRGIDVYPISMGIHLPAEPQGEVEFLVDWGGEDLSSFGVVLNGELYELDLQWGSENQGIYGVDVSLGTASCLTYYFRAESAGELIYWPEEGSYGWGDCAFDDPLASWIGKRASKIGGDTTDAGKPGGNLRVFGCTSVGSGAAWWALLGVLALRRRW